MNNQYEKRTFFGTLGAAFGLVFNNFFFILIFVAVLSLLILLLVLGSVLLIALVRKEPEILHLGAWLELARNSNALSHIDDQYPVLYILLIPVSFLLFAVYPVLLHDRFWRTVDGSCSKRNLSVTLVFILKKSLSYMLLHPLLQLTALGGTALLIVPGVVVFSGWSLAECVNLAEGRKPQDSLRRSWQLTRGMRWRIYGLHAVKETLTYIAYTITSFTYIILLFTLLDPDIVFEDFLVYFFLYLSYFFTVPLRKALSWVVYKELIHKREGMHLQHLEQQFFDESTQEF